MVATAKNEAVQTFILEKETLIAAPIDIAFETLLDQLGPAGESPDGTPMPLVLEAWPGGRWLRDLGKNTGHLWGHVQVIKPPTILEICGPMFMSYACANHIQYRLITEGHATRLKLTHRALGMISTEHHEGVVHGWESILNRTRELAESKLNGKRGLP